MLHGSPTYLGEFVGHGGIGDDAALAFLRARKWDTHGDGTGGPQEGHWYSNTTDEMPRYFLSGMWRLGSASTDLSTCVLSGCLVKKESGSDTEYLVEPGVVQFVEAGVPPLTTNVKKLQFPGARHLTTPYLTTTTFAFVGINIDGNVVPFGSVPMSSDYRNAAILGKVTHPNRATISATTTQPSVPYFSLLQLGDLVRAIGSRAMEGNAISPNGANLRLNRSAGRSFRWGVNYPNNILDPHYATSAAVDGILWRYRWRQAGDWATVINADTLVPGKWDNGTGTLGDVGPSKWTVQALYQYPGTDLHHVLYGQKLLDSKTDAQIMANSMLLCDFPKPDAFRQDAMLRALIGMRGNATSLLDESRAFIMNREY